MRKSITSIPKPILKSLKTNCLIVLMVVAFGSLKAQNFQTTDLIATWTGTDASGVSYVLTLNADNTALLKVDNDTLDVKWWKLVYDPGGEIEIYKGYATLRLISDLNATPVSLATQSLALPSGSQKKTYLAAIKLDASFAAMEMKVDFVSGSSMATGFARTAVEITFTK